MLIDFFSKTNGTSDGDACIGVGKSQAFKLSSARIMVLRKLNPLVAVGRHTHPSICPPGGFVGYLIVRGAFSVAS